MSSFRTFAMAMGCWAMSLVDVTSWTLIWLRRTYDMGTKGCQARQRLSFSDGRVPTPLLAAAPSYQESDGGLNKMIVDKEMVLVLGNETSKRKLDDTTPPERVPFEPSVVGWGVLNEIVYHGEKLGGPPKCQNALDNFINAFFDDDLHDLGFSGYKYTWCNHLKNGVIIEERLDCFCADTERIVMYPNAFVMHVNLDMSDHLPILLKCCPSSGGRVGKCRRFMFENMWILDPSCADVVSAAWFARDDVVEHLVECMETYAGELSRWNKKVFGQCQRGTVSRWEILGQIRELRRREEILWWQQAHSDYLKYGDANTRWFHTRANMRRSRNSIHYLVDDTTRNETYANWQVSDLIDHDNVAWCESFVRDIFLPYDAECILSIPLHGSWPDDKLIWHYNNHGFFSVRSTYHMLIEDSHATMAGMST
ncbi:LOW QUALITY PROTEIN: hypothetical protein Cgig2_001046 [Carnegiea gigantea]|uniref:Uncharacterized protein n=1 Tax=Carnegiea gigantea TaxID=171969 RepID=A0A9Q1JNG1_9CARY|nr:LOW QUALITY PROTEIN: hypothetical protein Cgig2_001046 [Carnegiea gigantea]